MLELVISWVAIALCAVIIWRARSCGLFRTYSFFYLYVGGMLVLSVVGLVIYAKFLAFYRATYWTCEFLTLLLACGIILEIFRHVFELYPGPRKFAQIAGISAFAMAVFFFCISPLVIHSTSIDSRMEDLEKNLRAIQALFLMAVISLIVQYRIRLGRNMKGMMGGYALAVAAGLASMAANSFTGGRYSQALGILRQLGYTLPFVVWTITLWSYAPSPEDSTTAQIEIDYERMIGKTRRAMLSVRSYIGRAVHP